MGTFIPNNSMIENLFDGKNYKEWSYSTQLRCPLTEQKDWNI